MHYLPATDVDSQAIPSPLNTFPDAAPINASEAAVTAADSGAVTTVHATATATATAAAAVTVAATAVATAAPASASSSPTDTAPTALRPAEQTGPSDGKLMSTSGGGQDRYEGYAGSRVPFRPKSEGGEWETVEGPFVTMSVSNVAWSNITFHAAPAIKVSACPAWDAAQVMLATHSCTRRCVRACVCVCVCVSVNICVSAFLCMHACKSVPTGP